MSRGLLHRCDEPATGDIYSGVLATQGWSAIVMSSLHAFDVTQKLLFD